MTQNFIDHLLVEMKARQRRLWLSVAVAFILCFSVYTMMVFVVGSDFLGMGRRSLVQMLDGTAMRPHVYRNLVPMIINGIVALSPDVLVQSVTEGMHSWMYNPPSMFARSLRFRHVTPPMELADPNLYPFAVAVLVDYGFLLGYLYFVWKLVKQLMPQYFSAQVIGPVIALLAIPPFCGKFAYIYDFPVLFFSAWMTWLLVERRLVLFTAGVAVATFNKETSFFFIMLFAMYGYRQFAHQQWKAHLLCQVVLFAVIKGGITMYYQQVQGDFLWVTGPELHLMKNLDGYSVYSFLGIIAGIVLLGSHWRDLPVVLRCWIWMVPVSVLSWFCFGQAFEFRVMYEVFPALLVIAAMTIAACLQGRDEVETTPENF